MAKSNCNYPSHNTSYNYNSLTILPRPQPQFVPRSLHQALVLQPQAPNGLRSLKQQPVPLATYTTQAAANAQIMHCVEVLSNRVSNLEHLFQELLDVTGRHGKQIEETFKFELAVKSELKDLKLGIKSLEDPHTMSTSGIEIVHQRSEKPGMELRKKIRESCGKTSTSGTEAEQDSEKGSKRSGQVVLKVNIPGHPESSALASHVNAKPFKPTSTNGKQSVPTTAVIGKLMGAVLKERGTFTNPENIESILTEVVKIVEGNQSDGAKKDAVYSIFNELLYDIQQSLTSAHEGALICQKLFGSKVTASSDNTEGRIDWKNHFLEWCHSKFTTILHDIQLRHQNKLSTGDDASSICSSGIADVGSGATQTKEDTGRLVITTRPFIWFLADLYISLPEKYPVLPLAAVELLNNLLALALKASENTLKENAMMTIGDVVAVEVAKLDVENSLKSALDIFKFLKPGLTDAAIEDSPSHGWTNDMKSMLLLELHKLNKYYTRFQLNFEWPADVRKNLVFTRCQVKVVVDQLKKSIPAIC